MNDGGGNRSQGEGRNRRSPKRRWVESARDDIS